MLSIITVHPNLRMRQTSEDLEGAQIDAGKAVTLLWLSIYITVMYILTFTRDKFLEKHGSTRQ